MGLAPDPTELARDEAREENAKRVALIVSLTIDGARQSRRLDLNALGPADDTACRQATGFPAGAFIGAHTIGTDSLLVLWWLAGRQAGRRERYGDIVARFPTYQALDAADPAVEEEVDEDVADPEA